MFLSRKREFIDQNINEEYLKKGLNLSLDKYGKYHPTTARILSELGMSLLIQNKYTEAEGIMKDCVQIYNKIEVKDIYMNLNIKLNYFVALANVGKILEAYDLLIELIELILNNDNIRENVFYNVFQNAFQFANNFMRSGQFRKSEKILNFIAEYNNSKDVRVIEGVERALENIQMIKRNLTIKEEKNQEKVPTNTNDLLKNELKNKNQIEKYIMLAETYFNKGAIKESLSTYRTVYDLIKIDIHNNEKYINVIRSYINILTLSRNYSTAIDILSEQLEFIREQRHFDSTYEGIILSLLSIVLEEKGNYKEAENNNLKAIKLLEKSKGTDDLLTLSIVKRLANLYIKLNKIEEGEKIYNKITKIMNEKYKDNIIEIHTHFTTFGDFYFISKLFDKAEIKYRESLKIAEENFGKQHVNTAEDLQKLASVLGNKGKKEEAILLFERSYNIFRLNYGSNSQQAIRVGFNLGKYYTQSKEYDKAEKLLIEGLNFYKSLGKFDEVTMGLVLLSNMKMDQKNFNEVEKFSREALKVYSITGNEDDHNYSSILLIRQETLWHLKKYEELERIIDNIVERSQKSYFPGLELISILKRQIVVLEKLGKNEKKKDVQNYIEHLKMQQKTFLDDIGGNLVKDFEKSGKKELADVMKKVIDDMRKKDLV